MNKFLCLAALLVVSIGATQATTQVNLAVAEAVQENPALRALAQVETALGHGLMQFAMVVIAKRDGYLAKAQHPDPTDQGIDPELFTPSANVATGAYGYTAKPLDTSSCYYSSSNNNNDAYGYSATPNSNYRQRHATTTIELEHVSGYTDKGKSTIHGIRPTPRASSHGKITLATLCMRDLANAVCMLTLVASNSMGAAVIIGNVHETHNQQLLRGHDEEINALSMSNTGAFVASAQICSKRRQVRHRPGSPGHRQLRRMEPDERQIVSVGVDSCISVWNLYQDET
ncbi:hypothetical protein FI667_g10950, partial [Globisporangium splendens]